MGHFGSFKSGTVPLSSVRLWTPQVEGWGGCIVKKKLTLRSLHLVSPSPSAPTVMLQIWSCQTRLLLAENNTWKWDNRSMSRYSSPPPPLSSAFSLNLLHLSTNSPLFPPVHPVTRAAAQSSLLCRQNCKDSHLPFLFLVLSIHLPVSAEAEPASMVLSAQDTTFAQDLCCDNAGCLFVCFWVCACVCVCVTCLSPHLPPTQSSAFSFLPPVWLCRCLEGYRFSLWTCDLSHQHSSKLSCKDTKYLFVRIQICI